MKKEDIQKVQEELSNKTKLVAMLAPSFVAEFDFPKILVQLKKIGFDKIIELTFGAKMINREYHKQLESSKSLMISSVCPGIVSAIKEKFPKFSKNLARIDSPMIATAKICKKIYPKHKNVFVSPCYLKKEEAKKSKFVDFCITYPELKQLIKQKGVENLIIDKQEEHKIFFDKFSNEYTRIYPLAGGLSKTAHIRGILKKEETKIIDGVVEVEKFLNNLDKKIKFLDANFCEGGCIGGPCFSKNISLTKKKKRVLDYLKRAQHEDIPRGKEGVISEAKGLKFTF